MNVIAQSIARIGINYGPQHVGRIGLYGQTVQDGRSGYWRLFFTQLQEEANREREANVVAPHQAVDVVADVETAVVQVATPKKTVRKKVRVDPVEVMEPALFRPIPQFERVAEVDNFMVDAWQVTLSIRALVSDFNENKVKLVNEFDIANDEDDVELLLLVA